MAGASVKFIRGNMLYGAAGSGTRTVRKSQCRVCDPVRQNARSLFWFHKMNSIFLAVSAPLGTVLSEIHAAGLRILQPSPRLVVVSYVLSARTQHGGLGLCPLWAKSGLMHCNKQKDRLAAVSPKTP